MTKGIWLIFMQVVKKLKIWTLMSSFCESIPSVRWKSTKEPCLRSLKSDAKLEEKLTHGSKNDISNLMSFNAIWKFELWCASFVVSVLCLSPKRAEELCHDAKEQCKIWGETDLCYKKWVDEFGKFWPNTQKSQNLRFNGLFLTKWYNVWAKKLQTAYVSWQWKVMQYLKKNLLVVWKTR